MTEKQFIKAYDKYSDAIFRHLLFRVYNRDNALELTQEVFTRAWEYIARGKSITHIRGLLYKIANNLAIDYSRKKKEQSLDALQEKGFDPKFENLDIHATVELRRILEVLSRVDEPYQTAVRMRYFDGLNPKDIATALEESANVISVRIFRGVKMLKEKLT